MNTTIKMAQTKKEKILFKIQFFMMMMHCGRDKEAKESILEAIKLIEASEIK
tara:strand:- start:93 stop:248 length:156 start_codon:yes stop_codon:yes gene_type:complete